MLAIIGITFYFVLAKKREIVYNTLYRAEFIEHIKANMPPAKMILLMVRMQWELVIRVYILRYGHMDYIDHKMAKLPVY